MKKVDDNGFWRIKDNPISKVGVFPYLGKQISSELEPDKIYMVYRPAEELFSEEALESFNRVPVPLVEDHTMIGKDNTPAEEKGVEGVIQNVRRSGDKLIGDIAIYSDHMKDKINDGKKELSMGYYCQYELADGEYKGEHYDAIQREIRSNHVALVDRGRMGSDVRVYDAFCFDAAISTAEFNNNIGALKMANSQDADFKESDHPRDKDGKFTSGGGSSSGGTSGGSNPQKSSTNKNKKGVSTKVINSIKESVNNVLSQGGRELSSPYPGLLHSGVTELLRPRVDHLEEVKWATSEGGEIGAWINGRRYNFKYSFVPSELKGQLRPEITSVTATTRKYTTAQKNIEEANNFLKNSHNWPSAEKGHPERLHADMQEKIKGVFGGPFAKIVKHTIKDNSGEIIVRENRRDYRVHYTFKPDAEGKIKVGEWKITRKTNDALDISESKGVDMKNLKQSLDGDLVIEHEDEEEKKVADKCGKDADIDKRELIREIGAIAGQAGLSEELVRTLMQKAEELAYNGSEEGKATDEDELFEEEEEKKSEDADEEEILEEEKEVDDDDDEDKEKESEDEEEEEIEEKKDIEKSLDALPSQIIKMIAQRDALASKLKPIIGDFNYQTKTLDQVAKYACDALDIKVSSKNAKAAIKGYLAGYKKSAKKYSMDSAISTNKTNSQIAKYLKGE